MNVFKYFSFKTKIKPLDSVNASSEKTIPQRECMKDIPDAIRIVQSAQCMECRRSENIRSLKRKTSLDVIKDDIRNLRGLTEVNLCFIKIFNLIN